MSKLMYAIGVIQIVFTVTIAMTESYNGLSETDIILMYLNMILGGFNIGYNRDD